MHLLESPACLAADSGSEACRLTLAAIEFYIDARNCDGEAKSAPQALRITAACGDCPEPP